MPPSLAGFLQFIRLLMGISTTVLPDSDPVIQIAYQVAIDIVNPALQCVPSSSSAIPNTYARAVYNLAADNLVNYAQDQPDAANVAGSDPPQPYFAWMRTKLNINGFVGGVIQSSGDQGTSESMVVPDAMRLFTMMNLQQLKTPWGRAYMAIAQDYGYIVGVS